MYRVGLTHAWTKPHMEGGECCYYITKNFQALVPNITVFTVSILQNVLVHCK